MNVLALTLGLLLFLVLELNKGAANESFTFKSFIERHWRGLLLVLVLLSSVIILKKEIVAFFPISEPYINSVTIFLTAAGGPQLSKRLIETFQKKTATKFGINE